jgi:hypothetical protein
VTTGENRLGRRDLVGRRHLDPVDLLGARRGEPGPP